MGAYDTHPRTPASFDDIRQLLTRDDLDGALQHLQHLLRDSPLLDEVLQHAARLADNDKQNHLGNLTYEATTRTRNQVRTALLDLLRRAEGGAKQGVRAIRAVDRRIIRQQAQLSWYQRLLFGWLDKKSRQKYALEVQGIFDTSERSDLMRSMKALIPLTYSDATDALSRPFSATFFDTLDKSENDGHIYLLLGETGTGKSTQPCSISSPAMPWPVAATRSFLPPSSKTCALFMRCPTPDESFSSSTV
ncbi:MAG: hypothetical protein OHK0039_21760 [Bacteroidia bacterium]